MPLLANSIEFCDSVADSAKQIMTERLSGKYAKEMYENIDSDKNGNDDVARLKLIIDRSFQAKYDGSYQNVEAIANEFKSQEFLLCVQSHRSKD
jgi:acetylglutamate synthase